MFRKQVDQAQKGDKIGVLLVDVTKAEVEHGDVLTASGLDFRWKP
jgi:translation elongation factor EF-Tu-like GTPase